MFIVNRTIAWLEAERVAGRIPNESTALAHLEADWAERGPVHDFAPYYLTAARNMVSCMVDVVVSETGTYDEEDWIVDLRGKQIRLKPDRVLIAPNGTVLVQRVRTGRKSKSEASNRLYALLRRGATARHPGRAVSIETLYLATRESVAVSARDDEKSLDEYSGAIAGIETGLFKAKPKDARACPTCQCYFHCDFVNGIS